MYLQYHVYCFPQAEQGFIFYVHDGSETRADNFTVVANDTDLRKHSFPFIVHVNVTPINDEAPVVTVNRILKVGFLIMCIKNDCNIFSSIQYK